ncbi:MAG: hypothetical protein V1676_02850 [Candidatus Diapherotrites archaeon]
MGLKKKVLLVLLVLAAAGAVYVFTQGGLGGKAAEFGTMNSKFVQGGAMVPADAKGISEYRTALKDFGAGLGDGADDKALKLLTDSRMIFADIEQDISEAAALMKKTDFANPDCSAGGKIAQEKEMFSTVKSKAELVLENLNILLRDYPAQAAKLGIEEGGEYFGSAEGARDGAEIFIEKLNSYCAG